MGGFSGQTPARFVRWTLVSVRQALGGFGVCCLLAIWMSMVLAACGGSSGSDVVPVTIQAQPTEQTVVANGVARFSIQATGDGLTFQWQGSTNGGTSWSDISGAINSVLELSNVTADQDSYQFRAKVSGKSGAVISSAVALHVRPVVIAPSFTVDLSSPAEITTGNNVSLNITAAGTSLTYQWQSSTDGGTTWSNVSGGNAATLVLQAVPLTANGTFYRVQVSNSVGTATSKTAILAVKAATALPAITTQPQAVSVTAPNPATFTVAGSGSPTPTVQWQLSIDGGTIYTGISGATGTTYNTGATSTSQNNYRYRAVLTNSTGTVTSNAATLSVQAATVAPTITTAPANVAVTAGAPATFTVIASGTPTPTIQWQLSLNGTNWSNITGATSASYTTAALRASETGKRFRVVVTNSAGTATSAAAVLTVDAGFTKISADGQDLPINATTWSCVRHKATGLLWEAYVTRQSPVHPCASNAQLSCRSYSNFGDGRAYDASTVPATVGTLCGKTGWRLPTEAEGRALVSDPAYAIFPTDSWLTWFGTVTGDMAFAGWTSSQVVGNLNHAWLINFQMGIVVSGTYLFDSGTTSFTSVRLVR